MNTEKEELKRQLEVIPELKAEIKNHEGTIEKLNNTILNLEGEKSNIDEEKKKIYEE